MKKCPKCGREYEDTNTLCPSDGSVLQKDGDALVGQTLANKYRIEEKISEGGMGAVYRGTHVLMEKTVAVKVLHPALAADDKIVARFTREAKAASRISHPHAIIVTDFGEAEDGVVFLVMEYLRGRTLKEVVRGEGSLPLQRAAEIIRQVCGALDAAHTEGVVHRDLKSDNIMLEESHGGGDWAKVLDFGIAKIIQPEGGQDPELTAPNLIIGTPQYMSPEQCSQASEIDSRSDIYSLGVILYEMLAGHVPFTGDSPTAIMMKHIQEPVPSLLEARQDVPPAVARVVARALAKNPENRFQTAGALSEALAHASVGEAEAAPVSNATATAVGASLTDGQAAHGTNRIVVTTGENEGPRSTANEDYDEATVVRAGTRSRDVREEVVHRPVPPTAAAASFNPWKIALLAIVAIVAVFAVFYAMQGSESSTEDQTPPLMTDPNSQPVEAAQPPTGASENSLTPSAGAPLQTPNSLGGGAANVNSNANALGSPTPGADEDDTAENTNQANENTSATPEPTPTPRKAPIPPKVETNVNSAPVDEDEAPARSTPAPKSTPPPSADDNDDEPAPVAPSL